MDALPIFLTSVLQDVTSIRVKRINDAGKRRQPLRRKVGAGLEKAEFQKLIDAKKVRHVGLRESMQMLADAMGWKVDRVEELTSAMLPQQRVSTAYLTVEPGQVARVHQVGTAFVADRPVITLELQMYVGAPKESSAILVNAATRVADLPPGLRTMKDLPPAHYRSS